MRHSVPVAGTQWYAPFQRDVQERSGKEETSDGGGRVAGQHREGLRGLQETTGDGGKFQVPGAGDDGG